MTIAIKHCGIYLYGVFAKNIGFFGLYPYTLHIYITHYKTIKNS